MAAAISELPRREQYVVDVCGNGLSGMDAALSGVYDAMILDVMLPGASGFEIVQKCRQNGIRTPVLLPTAKSDTTDKVYGLDSGADDYLTKPFQVDEPLTRVRALCRRNAPTADGSLRACGLRLSQKTISVSCVKNGQEIRLSEKEYRLSETLIVNLGRIAPREELAVKVWGYANDAEYNNVEV